jgi:very-short-patch-repair endonuclease
MNNEKIIVFLKANPGSKATLIARELGLDKKEINKILYGQLRGQCRQDASYGWYLNDDLKNEKSTGLQKQIDTPLAKLCNYYSACIAEDTGAKVSVFAQSNFALDYAEIENLPLADDTESELFKSSEVQGFLREARIDKSKSVYFGYPVMLSHAHSSKSGWDGYFVEPIFLFSVKEREGSGGIELDLNFPVINRKVLEKFTDTKGEELMKELIQLEEDLGISGTSEQPELDDLVQRLKSLRPEWQWLEEIDPYNLTNEPSIANSSVEGIMNRAVILKVQEAPNSFTQGLEYELNQLSKLSEDDYKDTALGQWVRRDIQHNNEKNLESLLEVFPMNLEQREAVQSSLVNKLTIITGPPGTGKSQVVTNLLINAAWQNKRVLFASKNNKAVDVVETRINNIGTRPILLRLGGGNFQEQLVSYLSSLLATTSDTKDEKEFTVRKSEFEKIHSELLNIDSQINDVVSLRNIVDRLDRGLTDTRAEISEDLLTRFKSLNFDILDVQINTLLTTLLNFIEPRLTLLAKLQHFVFKKKRQEEISLSLGVLNKTLSAIEVTIPVEKITDINLHTWESFYNELKNRWLQVEQLHAYLNALKELQASEPLEVLAKKRQNLLERMSSKSSVIWELWLKLQTGRLSDSDRSLLSQYRSTLQMVSASNPAKSVWRDYYVQTQKISHILSSWAITSLSAKGRIPLGKDIFDLVVFDESSQCDIASALPLLYRAKRAVIIGDPKQLSHISSISKKQDERLLEKYGLLGVFNDWAYSYNSLFDVATGLSRGTDIINLLDHYRSHADIIDFSNEYFYGGRLRVATRYDSLKRPKGSDIGIRWEKVNGRAEKPSSGSGSQNKKEAEAVLSELRRLYEQKYDGTIGVVSPFRAQANLIRKIVAEDGELTGWLSTHGFMSETVHKFQGDEKDIIIFSPVISTGTPKGSILFLEKTGNLFNVAITRARAMLIVVGNYEAVLNSGIPYMEKFAQHVNTLEQRRPAATRTEYRFGPEYPVVANPERVSDWEHILYKALFKVGISTIPQYQEEMYTLDFALFNGGRKLNIEVDGEHYHRDWTGDLCYRDQIRNQRMFELGWDVMRFWVYEIKDDLDGCVSKIKKWVDS